MPNAHDERHHAELTGARRSPIERLRRALGPYLLIAPAAAFIGLIFLYSLVRLGYASLHTGDNGDSGPAQLDAYRFVLDDPIFRTAVKHNLLLLISVPVVLVLALAIALILHEGIIGWRVYRTVVFVPYILAIPVLGTTFVYLLSLERRRSTRRCATIGLGFLAQDWLGSPVVGAAVDRRDHHLPRARLRRGAVPRAAAEPARGGRPGRPASTAATGGSCARAVTLPQMTRRDHGVRHARADHHALVGLRLRLLDDEGRARTSRATSLELYIFDNAFTFRAPSFAAAAAILLLAASTVLIVVQVRRTSIEVNPE